MSGVRYSPDDIAALRADGDLDAFLLSLTGGVTAPTPVVAAPPEPAAPTARPGAWPAGTKRPTPLAPVPAQAWQHAVGEYRAWVQAGHPAGDFTCECGCTPGQLFRDTSPD